MNIREFLNSLPPAERERALGRLEGMSMAMRIARNRHMDAPTPGAQMEALNLASVIRIVQVQIGSGRQPFGDLSPDELDELWRIF